MYFYAHDCRFQILKGLYFSGVAPIPPDILHYDNILWRPTLAAAAAAAAASSHCGATVVPASSHVTPSPLSSSGSEDVSLWQYGLWSFQTG